MKILKFEGASMREALAKVKAELGDQAVVVSTRQIRRGLLGSGYEIAAAIESGDDAPAEPTPTPAPRPAWAARPTLDDGEVERVVAPLRAELRSLRAMVRARADERGTQLGRAARGAGRAAPRGRAAARRGVAAAGPAETPGPRTGSRGLVASSTARAVMLVGPTGVGKTTTIAKLAARAALVEGRQVAIVTLDNYRVGGIDQIRTFADLIGVPLRRSSRIPAGLGDVPGRAWPPTTWCWSTPRARARAIAPRWTALADGACGGLGAGRGPPDGGGGDRAGERIDELAPAVRAACGIAPPAVHQGRRVRPRRPS
jgi:hypothetical protein